VAFHKYIIRHRNIFGITRHHFEWGQVQLTVSAMNRAVMPTSTEFDRSRYSWSIPWES